MWVLNKNNEGSFVRKKNCKLVNRKYKSVVNIKIGILILIFNLEKSIQNLGISIHSMEFLNKMEKEYLFVSIQEHMKLIKKIQVFGTHIDKYISIIK